MHFPHYLAPFSHFTITEDDRAIEQHVETKLFLQGRDAWMFRWHLLNEKYPISSKEPVSLEVVAKLKKEFHQYQKTTDYIFSCRVKIRPEEPYNPKLSIESITS